MPSARLPDDVGTSVWVSNQNVDVLARVVVRAFDAVIFEYGEDGYEKAWGRPFPTMELRAYEQPGVGPTQAPRPISIGSDNGTRPIRSRLGVKNPATPFRQASCETRQ